MCIRDSAHAAAENQELSKALDAFQDYLLRQNMASNTITAYVYGVKHFYSCYDRLSPDNISLYKVSLMDHYQPQTVNIRIRALNCFLKFLGIRDYKIRAVRVQQKSYLDHVISQADYEYLKRRLWDCLLYTSAIHRPPGKKICPAVFHNGRIGFRFRIGYKAVG